MTSKIRVLIVDDSRLMRDMISGMLSSDDGIEVVGTAEDPFDAREKIKSLNPDVMTLDINMPKMDGIEFLKKVMRLRPMPVIMFSTLTQEGADATLRALEIGAFDYAAKPTEDIRQHFDRLKRTLIEKVKSASRANLTRRGVTQPSSAASGANGSLFSNSRFIVVGASTGGVEALRALAPSIPVATKPILIVQHMPDNFTGQFARRLSSICSAEVKEATDGEPIKHGFVYIAPGHSHLTIKEGAKGLLCALDQDEKISGHRPAVDKLFASAAKVGGGQAGGIILTGMGRDGAQGMKTMRDAGAVTLGQSEKSCLIYGMPKAAAELGAVQHTLSLEQIGEHLAGSAGNRRVYQESGAAPAAQSA